MTSMEQSNSYGLSHLCRVCLLKTEMMSDLFDTSKDLCYLFKTVANIELERHEMLPNFLCSICEEKILICEAFITQCKKTNDLLETYRSDGIKIEEEESKVFLNTENVESADNIQRDNSSSDCPDFETDIKHTKVISLPDENVQKFPLKQIPYEEVMRVIETIKNKFNGVRNCSKCNYRARNFRSLSLHMSYMHKELKDKWCPTCNGIFDNFEEHLNIHDKKENFCQFCGRCFAERRFLIEHILTHSSKKTRPHKCDVCYKSFIHIKNLRTHKLSHLEDKPFVCNFCGSTFTQKHSLKMHLERVHKDETEFLCIYCKCQFQSAEMLMTHTCTENTANIFSDRQNYCTTCDKKVRSLTLHNRKYHDEGRKIEYTTTNLCTVCGKQIKSYARFEAHMRIHTGETPFSCSYCDKKMTRRCLLVAHERTHTGVRPYICDICNKDFTQRSSLNTHMKLHSDKQDVCIICGKAFYRIADLRLHLKKHTGEKPFVCSTCGKGFAQKSHLAAHVKTHKNDKTPN